MRINYDLELQLEVVGGDGLWQRRTSRGRGVRRCIVAKGDRVQHSSWKHEPSIDHVHMNIITWSAASRAIRYTGVGEELADCRGVEGPTVLELTLVHHDNGVCVAEEFDLERVKSCQIMQTLESEETENMQQQLT